MAVQRESVPVTLARVETKVDQLLRTSKDHARRVRALEEKADKAFPFDKRYVLLALAIVATLAGAPDVAALIQGGM